MKTIVKTIKERYKEVFTQARVRSLAVALLLFALAMVFQGYASSYSIRNSGRFVGDFFLDNLPAVNTNVVIVEGALLAVFASIILLLSQPRYVIFTLKAAAIFIALRAFFIAVTHLGIYPDQIMPDGQLFDHLYVALGFEAGYFFSAHTGLPILIALIFWNRRALRYIYLGLAVVFGVSVLLAKVHYSIDVFAAPFMTYSIFQLAKYFFEEDYRLTQVQVQTT